MATNRYAVTNWCCAGYGVKKFTNQRVELIIWRTNCQPVGGIPTHCHATIVIVSGATRFRSALRRATRVRNDGHGKSTAKDGAFVALARRAVGGPFHFNFPRQRIAIRPRAEANAFK